MQTMNRADEAAFTAESMCLRGSVRKQNKKYEEFTCRRRHCRRCKLERQKWEEISTYHTIARDSSTKMKITEGRFYGQPVPAQPFKIYNVDTSF